MTCSSGFSSTRVSAHSSGASSAKSSDVRRWREFWVREAPGDGDSSCGCSPSIHTPGLPSGYNEQLMAECVFVKWSHRDFDFTARSDTSAVITMKQTISILCEQATC